LMSTHSWMPLCALVLKLTSMIFDNVKSNTSSEVNTLEVSCTSCNFGTCSWIKKLYV
jgi:hypothetical protein